MLPNATPRFRHRLAALGLLAVLVGLSACASTSTPGPSFAPAPEPAPGFARVYVFRVDPQHSLSTVEIALDGERPVRLSNGEYATFELPVGSHRIDFRQRGLAFASWGWNRQRLRARDGETTYLEISVRISAQPVAGSGRDMEIAGRDMGSASENVFIQHRSRSDALRALAATTLRTE
jgi:hypothetical protein